MQHFLAKSDPEETIQQHTINLMENYNILRELYPNIKYLNWDILKLACLYHDLGKMNTKFQNKIMKKLGYDLLKDELQDIQEVNHNFLSPAFLPKKKLGEKYDRIQLKVLYQAIYRHHNRNLPHIEDIKNVVEMDLSKYIKEFKIEGYDILKEIDLSEGITFKYRKEVKDNIIPMEDGIDTFYSYVITKGLLNKIDYAASSYISEKRLSVELPNKDLKQKVNEFFYRNSFEKNSLQDYMESNSNENNIIIASTGERVIIVTGCINVLVSRVSGTLTKYNSCIA